MTIRVLGEHHLLGHWRVADFLGGHPQKKTPMFETSLLWEGMFFRATCREPCLPRCNQEGFVPTSVNPGNLPLTFYWAGLCLCVRFQIQ